MRFPTKHIAFIFATSALLLSSVFAGAKKPRGSQSADADARKADYIYLEAKRQNLQDRNDAYYELMDYARQLNPNDKLLGMDLGIYYAHLDTLNPTKGIDLMEDYVENNPEDLYNAFMYARFCSKQGDIPRALHAWELLHNRFPDRQLLTQQYADILRATRDTSNLYRALELYDSLEISGDDPINVASSRASVRYMLGDTAGVTHEVDILLSRNPNNPTYNIFAGQIYQGLLGSDSALVFFNRAVELDPTNGMAYYSRANYYNTKNDSVGFDREVFNALRQSDLELDVKMALMRDYVVKLYEDSTQQPRIAELFDILGKQHPHQPDVNKLYTDYLVAIQNYGAAAEQLDYAMSMEPDNQRGWNMLSSLYLQSGSYDKSIDAAHRGLHYYPDDSGLMELEITSLTQAERFDEAMAVLDSTFAKVDTLDMDLMSELYSMRGDIFYKKEMNDSAFAAYERALDYNPVNYMAMNNAAYYMACTSMNLDKALSLIQTATTGRPDDPTTLDTYAWVLFKRKDYQKAREIIDRVLELDDEPSEEVLEHAGDIYFMDSDPDQAVEFWKQALELNQDNDLLKRKVQHKTYFHK